MRVRSKLGWGLGLTGTALLARIRRAASAAESGKAALATDAELSLPEDLLHHRVATDDGGEVHVIEKGDVGSPVLLVHGFSLTSAVWAYQLWDISTSYRVLAVDQRGHGRSRSGSDPKSVSRLGQDLLNVLENLDIKGAVVVGHSMGSMAVLKMLSEHAGVIGDRVSGAVLLSASGGPMAKLPGWNRSSDRLGLAGAAAMARAGERLSTSPAGSYIATRAVFGRRPVPAHVEMARELMSQATPEVQSELLGPVLGFDVSVSLGSIALPVLVVAGTKDRLTPPRHAQRLAGALPDARLRRFPDCGHMAMLERRWEVDGAIEAFALDVSGSPRAPGGERAADRVPGSQT
ncbi:MAG: alpha/beta fold hydrolase [Mycobacterium sp.]